ncbi:N-acetylmuramoyl-L-alanine amidase [Niveispirillum sp. SYP-B3756]|uniref:N-acetylmuramoyl-L-alanine amidase n=1 Tax=Niveispirillum sp. SYP-B3756 TaxID=2662178 RepID=UPI001291B214|nr:N-acetylmuramoyl-L-alanine amidase [Niveispirillum sp. SYP-B3756]MQP67134.1 N-acetylmuramoyl-L-alanine amidase [Niveispirillum sp. SYP-B3756]
MPLPLIDHPSPNHGPRVGGPPDMLVLHYTGMPDGPSALARLCDPASQVSAHYLVGEDGTIWKLVAEERRAWHAGKSFWRGERDINSRSIGIELVNPGHEWGYRPFPRAQMEALIALCRDIMGRHPISPLRVLGHSDVAPDRKQDPGEKFDWLALAMAGIGAWPDPLPADHRPAEAGEVGRLLTHLGYETPFSQFPDGISWENPPPSGAGGISWEKTGENGLESALTAFQRHWAPESLGRGADQQSVAALRALVRLSAEADLAFPDPDA